MVAEFPGSPWAEDALNSLALADARDDQDADADQESLELFEGFPKGRYTERAAWRIGWRAYRTGNYAEAVRIFDRAAFNFPRSDYRPAWLYWSGRSHEALNEPELAEARYSVEVIDYLNTYHGRLALQRLGGRVPDRAAVVPARAATSFDEPEAVVTLPPNAALVKALLTAKIYDEAADELRYAQRIWGDSGPIEATFAWTYREQGHSRDGRAPDEPLSRVDQRDETRVSAVSDGGRRTAAAGNPADHLSDRVLGFDSEVFVAERSRSIRDRRADGAGVDVRGEHPIACQGGRPDAARTGDGPAVRQAPGPRRTPRRF